MKSHPVSALLVALVFLTLNGCKGDRGAELVGTYTGRWQPSGQQLEYFRDLPKSLQEHLLESKMILTLKRDHTANMLYVNKGTTWQATWEFADDTLTLHPVPSKVESAEPRRLSVSKNLSVLTSKEHHEVFTKE